MKSDLNLIKDLVNKPSRTKKDITLRAKKMGVNVSTIYRWIKKCELEMIEQTLGTRIKNYNKTTEEFRSDPDLVNIINQEIGHFNAIQDREGTKLILRTSGFFRRYETIQETFDQIALRLENINSTRPTDNKLHVPSYQAIWKKIQKRIEGSQLKIR